MDGTLETQYQRWRKQVAAERMRQYRHPEPTRDQMLNQQFATIDLAFDEDRASNSTAASAATKSLTGRSAAANSGGRNEWERTGSC